MANDAVQNTGQFAKIVVTNAGKEMIAKSHNGQTLTFTRVALGDGQLASNEDILALTAIKNERLSAPIAQFEEKGNGMFAVQFRVSNQSVETGFWHREIGLMARVDNGQEQLYAYTTAGNKASFLYDKTTPNEERIVNLNFVIGNAQNVQVIINNSIIYPTVKQMETAIEKHNTSADSHQFLQCQIKTKQDKLTFDTAPTAGSINPVTSGGVKTALDGKLGKSDNAVSATKLQTARKINGVAFDGTADITILNGISDIYTFTKTLTLTTGWQDSGIHGTPTSTGYDLPSGSYIVQVSGMDSSTKMYGEIFTGLMTFYAFETNNISADEIILHKSGHASNDIAIYLRTLRHWRSSKIGLTLQIKASTNLPESPYTFKFRKLI